MEMMKVVLVEPLQNPRVIEFPHTLENMQKLVGGHIEAVYPYDDPVGVIVNEEGKLEGLPPNRVLMDDEGNPYDILCGTFFICGLGDTNFASISDELAEKYIEKFYWPEAFMGTDDGHIMWFKIMPGKSPVKII